MSEKKEKKEALFRKWFITRYPHEDDEIDLTTIWQRWQKKFESAPYLAGQIEHGKSGKWHIQAAVHFKRGCTTKEVVKRLGGNGVHVEPQMGTNDDIKRYVSKPAYGDEKEFHEHGEPIEIAGQGARTDLKEAALCLKEKGEKACFEEHPGTFVRYNRGLREAVKAMTWDPEYMMSWRDVQVIILWGRAGAGKSRQAKELAVGGLYMVSSGARAMDMTKKPYFKQYRGEGTIMFQEYTGWCPYADLMEITDGQPYMAEDPKEGMHQAKWTRVIFTSPEHPREWYKKFLKNKGGWDGEFNEQFHRRIIKLVELKRPKRKLVKRYVEEEAELDDDEVLVL